MVAVEGTIWGTDIQIDVVVKMFNRFVTTFHIPSEDTNVMDTDTPYYIALLRQVTTFLYYYFRNVVCK